MTCLEAKDFTITPGTENGWKTYTVIPHTPTVSLDEPSVPFSTMDLRSTLHPAPSPMETILLDDRILYVKRDDLLRLPGSHISGNKARKFLALNSVIPEKDLPSCIVSHGGPQSNSMLALAALCHSKSIRFVWKVCL